MKYIILILLVSLLAFQNLVLDESKIVTKYKPECSPESNIELKSRFLTNCLEKESIYECQGLLDHNFCNRKQYEAVYKKIWIGFPIWIELGELYENNENRVPFQKN